ncbi:MAG: prepilin-type N-terminal cleavage/methylation domain-containing protein [Pseudomonadota bacterium]
MFRDKVGFRGCQVVPYKPRFVVFNSRLGTRKPISKPSRSQPVSVALPHKTAGQPVKQSGRVPAVNESRVPTKQSGFTLIEVMAAFAIFAVLFGVILQILSTSVSNTRRSGDFTQAALIAQAQLDMVGVEEMPQPGSYSGDEGERYRWVMDIEPYFVSDDSGVNYDELPIDLYRVVLTVYWGENDIERSATFQTLRSVDRFYAERQLAGG